jgi:hypothetical protein
VYYVNVGVIVILTTIVHPTDLRLMITSSRPAILHCIIITVNYCISEKAFPTVHQLTPSKNSSWPMWKNILLTNTRSKSNVGNILKLNWMGNNCRMVTSQWQIERLLKSKLLPLQQSTNQNYSRTVRSITSPITDYDLQIYGRATNDNKAI